MTRLWCSVLTRKNTYFGLLVSLLTGVGCVSPDLDSRDALESDTSSVAPTPWFVDGTRESGLDFVHFNGMYGDRVMAEILGPGGALLDFDADGDLDLLLRQGAPLWPAEGRVPLVALPEGGLGDRLFRNDLDASGAHFVDATPGVFLGREEYGMGGVAADFDRDGYLDLYLTNFGPNRMLRGGEDGFLDVTLTSGTSEKGWSTAASAWDYDRDGWIDLFVGNYVELNPGNHRLCGDEDYCGPLSFRAQKDRLFRNRGDGSFEDVTQAAGLKVTGRTLGSVILDLDRDGWIDLYVANDASENLLWRNRGDGTFEEVGLMTGSALNAAGAKEASMGVDAGDFDGDGDEDLILGHLGGESNTLYVNQDGEFFLDRTIPAGLSGPSLPVTAFGLHWLDLTLNGRLDLLVVNGAIKKKEAQVRGGLLLPLREPNQLFINRGDGTFMDQSGEIPALQVEEVSRAAIFGDLDNDGDTDVVVTNSGSGAQLLVAEGRARGQWVGLHLVDDMGVDQIGSEARLVRSGASDLIRRVHVGGGYLSSHDPRLLFGLGGQDAIERLEVVWSDGSREEFLEISTGRYQSVVNGTGSSLE